MTTRTVRCLTLSLPLAVLAACAMVATPPSTRPQDKRPAGAQDKAQPDMQKLMAEMMEKATPGPEHKQLVSLAGTWDFTMKFRMDPSGEWTETKGTSRYRPVMDGRYVIEEVESTFQGMPFHGMQILGYSNLTKEHWSVWFDSYATWPMYSAGKVDPSGAIVMKGVAKDVMTPEGRPMRTVIRHQGDDKMTVEMYDTAAGGKEWQNMSITSTRQK